MLHRLVVSKILIQTRNIYQKYFDQLNKERFFKINLQNTDLFFKVEN